MNKLSTQIIAFVVVLAIVAGALYFSGVFSSDNGAVASGEDRTPRQIQILKYSDYSCPACRIYIPFQEQLKAEFGDLVDIQYRYFPLDGFPNSRTAAHAVEAANRQGKFTEMHNLVFERQDEWSPGHINIREYVTAYAEQIGLDRDQFLADLDSDEVRNRVEQQKQEGMRRSVNATPTYFIDGFMLRQNPQSYEQFKSIVELYMYRN
ncbi:MAG: hypothetical protein EA360_09260 [Balneolaceae bacterium]|nr:MAG: hypothetical protein EA360_09260 [Balneolaceae bacterium]